MPPAPHSSLKEALLPVETPAWNPASQNYATQGLWGMTAQDYRDTALPCTLSRN